jgi:hypothetical protein
LKRTHRTSILLIISDFFMRIIFKDERKIPQCKANPKWKGP